MSCTRCGMCCFPFAIGIGKDDDIGRWLVYHGLIVDGLDADHMVIKGQSKCHMLVLDAGGTTSCGCYENRPQICRDYLCDRAKQGSEE